MKRAIIIGARGQDGMLLTTHLMSRGYAVLGISRRDVVCSRRGVQPTVDLLETPGIQQLIENYAPDEIYYLAAFHHSAQATELLSPGVIWDRSFDVHVRGLINVLEAMRRARPDARLFYAASSLVFGSPPHAPQAEDTPLNPRCVYGVTKTAGLHCCRVYREQHGLFACAGILYTHESPLRRESFLSRKVVQAAVRIHRGEQKDLVLGDLAAQSEWGWAADYVDAMHRILLRDSPEDFVVATGTLHCVLDWVQAAFGAMGLAWQDYVREDRSLIKRAGPVLVGDASRLRQATGWRPTTSFPEMVRTMLRSEGACC